MDNKKFFLALIFIFILILSLNFVSASQENETLSVENENLEMDIDTAESILSEESLKTLNGGTFDDIQNAVDECDDGDTIELNGTYESIGNSIHVNKDLTIKGINGAVLDGKNASVFFHCNKGKSVILNGLTFINSYDEDPNVDSISIGYGKIINCNFKNNYNRIYCFNPCIFVNCSFMNSRTVLNPDKVINCSFTNTDSGAISHASDVLNCTFINNTGSYGGISYVGLVVNCKFVNNIGHTSGAIYNASDILNCTFINNSAEYGGSGGVINVGSIVNCKFINNSVKNTYYNSGGAVYGSKYIINSTFINNSVASKGGAVYNSWDIINCNFTNNSALSRDDNVDCNCSINNCNFVNTAYIFCSNIVNSTFENSSVYCNNVNHSNVLNCNFKNHIKFFTNGNISLIKCNFTGNGYGDNLLQLIDHACIADCIFYNMNYIRIYSPHDYVVNSSFVKTSISNSYYGGYSQIFNCTFEGCKSYALEISDVSVSDCNFLNNSGGFIKCGGCANIINCNFVNNHGNYAGGISGYFLNVSNSNFVNNSARYGVAIIGIGNISNCKFVNNSAKDGVGAIDFEGSVINCTFIENKVANTNFPYYYSCGGAMMSVGNSTILNCSFIKNSADYGGAIDITHSTIIINCTFNDNYARAYGSVILLRLPHLNKNETIINSVFSNNHADILSNNLGWPVRNYANSAIVQAGYASGFDDSSLSIINCTGLSKNNDKYKIKTKIVASPLTMMYKSGKYLIITLKNDDFPCTVNNVKISININGKIYNKYTNNKGQAKLQINLLPKTYTAKITYNGDNFYLKATKNVKITVKKLTPKLTASTKSFGVNVKTKKYSVTLKDNKNNKMKNTKITLKINGKTITAKTNSKGIATFSITKLSKKGTYKATVTYNGNSYYNKVNKQVKIFVK